MAGDVRERTEAVELQLVQPIGVVERLRNAEQTHRPQGSREWPLFMAFDVLAIDGKDLRGLPLVEWKRRLARIMPRVESRVMLLERLKLEGDCRRSPCDICGRGRVRTTRMSNYDPALSSRSVSCRGDLRAA